MKLPACRLLAGSVGLCLFLLLAACGSANTVSVQYQGYHMALDRTSVHPGPLTFNLTNQNGQVTHEFVVARTDTPADQLAVNGTQVDETKLTIIARSAKLDVGQTGTLAIGLPPGHYVLFCNIVGHYQLGMHADLAVTP